MRRVWIGVLVRVATASSRVCCAVDHGEIDVEEFGFVFESANAPRSANVRPKFKSGRCLWVRVVGIRGPRSVQRRRPPIRLFVFEVVQRSRSEHHRRPRSVVTVPGNEVGDTRLGGVRFHESRHGSSRTGHPRVPLGISVRVPALKRGMCRVQYRRVHDLRRSRPYFQISPTRVSDTLVVGLVFGKTVTATVAIVTGPV